ncbi:Cathepsin_B [Hexamita inflata]|uniref:Cathepsin B n=1 Tax=Hexamita inflata TaxID=28002 RepID=A0AA86UR34_9EUKA|nr:Cathepsin B [Hexamita inflata]
MLSVSFTLASSFLQEHLEVLRKMPDMTWTPGIPSIFKDKSQQQLKSMLMHVAPISHNVENARYVGEAPESLDWPSLSPECVNVLKNQEMCGSCWAFSAIGAFSDRRCISKKDSSRVHYSEEFVVTCDKIDQGCNGGYLNTVWIFLQKTGTVPATCNTYKSGGGKTGVCPTACDDGSAFPTMTKSISHKNVCTGEESMKLALVEGPLTTGFTVYLDFQMYMGGIYSHKYGPNMGGHAVEFVGYGEENGVKYWTVKNSWGAHWGEKGYFRIVRGTNECGIEEQCFAAEV